jgi:serine/threonine-protein kinase
VVVTPLFLIMLVPGGKTPKSTDAQHVAKVPSATGAPTHTPEELVAYLSHLPEREAAMAAMARDKWMKTAQENRSNYPVHTRLGSPSAPVKVVDVTDVLCPHCRNLALMLDELYEMVPEGSVSLEPRYFPLDGECNPEIAKASGDGVRCLGAKLQICLEPKGATFWAFRKELFLNQPQLSKDKLWELAGHTGVPRAELEACVAAPETQSRLNEDIRYSMTWNIEGTPLVVLNGRETYPSSDFILGMVMSKGDVNAPYFQKLPPPPPMP